MNLCGFKSNVAYIARGIYIQPSPLASVSHVPSARPRQLPKALTPAKRKSCVAVAITASAPSSRSTADVAYETTLFVRGDAKLANARLLLTVVAEDDGSKKSATVDISSFQTSSYQPGNPSKSGTNFSGSIKLPSDLIPGVVILKLEAADGQSTPAPIYLRKLTLSAQGKETREFLSNSYIDPSHGDRFIFPSKGSTPAETPAGVREFRRQDLSAYKGEEANREVLRKGADRIYGFDTYNDLGKPEAGIVRPTLGGPKMPFPRRIQTNRGLDADGFEKRIPDDAGKLPWVPIDERFTLIKEKTFEGLNQYSKGAVVSSPQGFVKAVIGLPSIQKKLVSGEFRNLGDIEAMYDDLRETDAAAKAALPALQSTHHTDILHSLTDRLDSAKHSLQGHAVNLLEKLLKRKKEGKKGVTPPDPADIEGSLPSEELTVLGIVQFLSGIVHRWPVPNVRKGRKDLWHTDEDFGRQIMEGQNPLAVRVLTEADLGAIKASEADVEGLLEGSTLAQRVSEGKLYILDLHTNFIDFVKRVNALPGPNKKERVMYAGRCILYSREDKALVPVAIELETEGVPLTVYTPRQSPQLWRLAKTIINSLEIWHHQAIVHLLQTHLVVEPYIIATRRELSILHPINKLLQPAFRWTMRPNADARQNLIAADGIIETSFTTGSLSMQLISQIYDKEWRFDTQSLPTDLLARGVAKKGPKGLEVTLPGYSYAEDALLIFEALDEWVGKYIALYYSDSEPGRKVTDDEELVNWWKSVRFEGHPDKKEGFPELEDVASLRNILTTIMWTTGPHHAAVNYGQYQYSGYMPNRPSMIRKKIPIPGSQEEKDLAENFEEKLMSVISDPLSTATLMLMTKLLSHHSADEEFINAAEHPWIRDPAALELYGQFVERLGAAEEEIGRRNKSEARLRGGKGAPYTQMMPSVDASTLQKEADGDIGYQVSYRGIPNSIAI